MNSNGMLAIYFCFALDIKLFYNCYLFSDKLYYKEKLITDIFSFFTSEAMLKKFSYQFSSLIVHFILIF